MRTIEQTGQLKREAKGPRRQALASDFIAIVTPWRMTCRWPRSTATTH